MHEPTRADLALMRALNAEVEQMNGEMEQLNRDAAAFLERLRGQVEHTEADHAQWRRIGERRRDLLERLERATLQAATANGTGGTA